MPLSKPLPIIIAILALFGVFLFAFFTGRDAFAKQEKASLTRTVNEHAASCGRLGSPQGSGQHDGCLRELNALKVLHDNSSAAASESFL